MISESKHNSTMVANTSLENPEYQIGKRIEICGDIGTIKYVGTIEGHPGIWLGIDWDDFSRGKHNGTVKGVQYFQTRHPKSGSFVRKEKVYLGQHLVEAIIKKYTNKQDEVTVKQEQRDILEFQQRINAPFIEFVGFEKVKTKQSNFHNLEVVNVRSQCVSAIGDPLELKNLFPNVRQLDISKNLITSWSDVFEICSHLKNLYWLNVSENLLRFSENANFRFPNITVFICGNMHLRWCDIEKVSQVFPNVEELRVPDNDINDLTTSVGSFSKLKLLDLGGNCIREWAEINKLSVIKNLEHLTLENTLLESIYFESELDWISEFDNLKFLNINQNFINEWRSVSELNKLKNLEELRFMKNPVLETVNLATREQIIIAKLANLKVLNGRSITDEERRGAEYDYIKKYGLEWLKVKNTDQKTQFLKEHNRYLGLIQKYGEPEESELVVPTNTLKTALITMNIVYEGKTITKKLPPSLLVQKLIMLVQKLFKLEDRPKLVYVSHESDIRIVLDDEMKEISYYAIKENDTIVVDV